MNRSADDERIKWRFQFGDRNRIAHAFTGYGMKCHQSICGKYNLMRGSSWCIADDTCPRCDRCLLFFATLDEIKGEKQ